MGLFGLTKDELGIWRRIRSLDNVRFALCQKPEQVYFSLIAAVENSCVSVRTPAHGTTFLEVPKNAPVVVEVFSQDFGKISFISKIISQEWKGERVIRIAQPKKIAQVQMRQFFRLPLILKVKFAVATTAVGNQGPFKLRYPVLSGFTQNISEGGLLLVMERVYPLGTLMNFSVPLSKDLTVLAQGKVVRHQVLADKTKRGMGIQFTAMDPEQRQLLRKFIFDRERPK